MFDFFKFYKKMMIKPGNIVTVTSLLDTCYIQQSHLKLHDKDFRYKNPPLDDTFNILANKR